MKTFAERKFIEFRDSYDDIRVSTHEDPIYLNADKVESFIEQILAEQAEEILGRVEKVFIDSKPMVENNEHDWLLQEWENNFCTNLAKLRKDI